MQRAADAAALAGVTYMPGNLAPAKAQALATAANGWTNGVTTGVDPEPVPGQPSKLRVTITTTVDNTFGQLLGKRHDDDQRTAVANYQAPLPHGQPVQRVRQRSGADARARDPRSANCAAAGQFWANIGSPQAPKSNGDAYQDDNCAAVGRRHRQLRGRVNSDYSNDGYFYSIKLSQPVSNLTIQAFDPAFVSVGDLCGANFGSGTTRVDWRRTSTTTTPARRRRRRRYTRGPDAVRVRARRARTAPATCSTPSSNQPPDTTYTIRQPVATFESVGPDELPVDRRRCTQTFKGFTGDLYTALNQYKQTQRRGPVQRTARRSSLRPAPAATSRQVARSSGSGSRCAPSPARCPPVRTSSRCRRNAAGDNPLGDGHNRFSMRAYGSSGRDKANIAISGYTDMAIYANLPSAHTSFYLTQVPPAAAGQVLDVRLFDIGDSSQPGTVTIMPPADSGLSSFAGCVGDRVRRAAR